MHTNRLHLHGSKETILIFLSIAVCLLLITFTSPASARTYNIAVISSGNTQTYTHSIDIIKDTVNKNSQSPVIFNTFFIDDLSAISNTKINNADLLLAIGQRAMLSVSLRKKSPPILVTLVTRQSFTDTKVKLKTSNEKVAAVFIDSPPERQILLAKLLLGKRQTVSVLISERNMLDARQIKTIVEKSDLTPQIETVSPSDNIIRKLTRAVDNSDALIAFPDPLIFNRATARNILLTTYRKRIPVIGFSASYVKAGALAAAFSTLDQIAIQTGNTAEKILISTNNFPHGGKYPENFEIEINKNVARSLGITTPPEELLKKQLKELLVDLK